MTKQMTIVVIGALRVNNDENKLLNCIVTGDEMWVHYAEPETNALETSWFPTSQEV